MRRYNSERGFAGGDRRRNISRDYERHSRRRFRDQNRDVDYGADMDRAYERSRSSSARFDDIHDRDRSRIDTRQFDDRFEEDGNVFERAGEKLGEFFGKGPKGYKRSDDRILEDVSETLWTHPQIDASEVEVTVRDGVVTVKGSVVDRGMKRMIEDEIEYLPGVRDVINNVRTQDRQSSMNSQKTSENGGRGKTQ